MATKLYWAKDLLIQWHIHKWKARTLLKKLFNLIITSVEVIKISIGMIKIQSKLIVRLIANHTINKQTWKKRSIIQEYIFLLGQYNI